MQKQARKSRQTGRQVGREAVFQEGRGRSQNQRGLAEAGRAKQKEVCRER
jgi:hypothetical protein